MLGSSKTVQTDAAQTGPVQTGTLQVPTADIHRSTRQLSDPNFLLVTLIVNLAVIATIATMLVRFRVFRRILVTERRGWPERLTFAACLGFSLAAGVICRLYLNFQAGDLTLAGS